MINTVSSVNHLGEKLVIDLRRPEKSGFLLTSPSGFGPIGADIKTTTYSSGDGYIYNSAMSNQREIQLPIIFWEYNDEGLTIEELRRKLYRYFPVKKKVTLYIETDIRVGCIEGYVRSCEPTIFEKQTSATVSIVCPNPWFHEQSMDYMKTVNLNPSNNKIEQNIYYSGDVATGIIFEFKPGQYPASFSIQNGTPNDPKNRMIISLDRSGGIPSNTKLVVSSIMHKMGIKRIEQNGDVNCLAMLVNSPDEWPNLQPGFNTISMAYYGGGIAVSMPSDVISMSYPIIYEGL